MTRHISRLFCHGVVFARVVSRAYEIVARRSATPKQDIIVRVAYVRMLISQSTTDAIKQQHDSFLYVMIIDQVQSAANTLPENVENTPEVPKEVEPSPPTLEPVKEEPTKEPMVDAPAPAEQPRTTEVPVETETRVEEPVEKTMVDASAPAEAPATEAQVDTETKVVEEAKEKTMVDAPAPTELQDADFVRRVEAGIRA
ncbi:hypothetical protein Tco_0776747 [Tanacetum coccineum]